MNQTELINNLKEKDVRAVARLLTLIEDEDERAESIIKEIWKLTGKSYIIGITGPPGAGKSTIVDILAKAAVNDGHKVGVLAVDPTSPFSGGALLGERLRMSSAQESGIFIRSVASRGHLGGLAATTRFMINAMELLGNDISLVETVGAGQGDVEIVKLADTTVVVEVPGVGDAVQAQKAGIIEIGDILVVNKGDRPGADRLAKEFETLGFFISDHPLNQYKTIFNQYNIISYEQFEKDKNSLLYEAVSCLKLPRDSCSEALVLTFIVQATEPIARLLAASPL